MVCQNTIGGSTATQQLAVGLIQEIDLLVFLLPAQRWRRADTARWMSRATANRSIGPYPVASGVLEMVRDDTAGETFGPTAYVFGDETGHLVKSIRRPWETAVLKSHDHSPIWVWTKGNSRKGAGKLSPQSRAVYRQIDLHFHDLRHEAGSRSLEAGGCSKRSSRGSDMRALSKRLSQCHPTRLAPVHARIRPSCAQNCIPPAIQSSRHRKFLQSRCKQAFLQPPGCLQGGRSAPTSC